MEEPALQVTKSRKIFFIACDREFAELLTWRILEQLNQKPFVCLYTYRICFQTLYTYNIFYDFLLFTRTNVPASMPSQCHIRMYSIASILI